MEAVSVTADGAVGKTGALEHVTASVEGQKVDLQGAWLIPVRPQLPHASVKSVSSTHLYAFAADNAPPSLGSPPQAHCRSTCSWLISRHILLLPVREGMKECVWGSSTSTSRCH